MTNTQLMVFVEIAEQRNFTHAGKVLNMTQPAVSHAISSLEKELDVTLIIRDRKQGIILTEVGKRILVHAREILKGQEKIEQEVAAEKGLEVGTIRIGSFSTASAYFLPKIVRYIRQKYPKIEFNLYEGTINEVREWLEKRVVDVGFITPPTKNFDIFPLCQDQMMILFHEDHPLRDDSTIHLEQLVNEELIICQGGSELPIIDQLSKINQKQQVKYHVHNTITALNMIQEELGVAILSELALATPLPKNIQKRELAPAICREIQLAVPAYKDASVVVKLFVETAKLLFQK